MSQKTTPRRERVAGAVYGAWTREKLLVNHAGVVDACADRKS